MTRAEITAVIAKYWETTEYIPNAEVTPLTDINGHWAETSINQVYNAGIINGFEDLTFKPDDTLKREQVAAIINNLINRPSYTNEQATYVDVNDTHWAYGEIEAASSYFNNDVFS